MGKNITVCSLFSGCGGLDLGFEGNFDFLGTKYEKNDFKIVFANDIEQRACETFENNFELKPHHDDIREFLENGGKSKIPDCDVVTGGFPCQDFSMAGKRKGLNSERGLLYKSMKRVIELKKPKLFLAENVKGLTNLGNVLDIIKKDFGSISPKYIVKHKLLNAAHYGVPQRRERVFIIGVREDIYKKYGPFIFPKPTKNESNWTTAKAALNDLINNDTITHQNQYSGARNYGSHAQGNKPIKADLPSITIRAEHHGNIEFHYSEPRRLTIRECARLQSFPDTFNFAGATSNIYKQIGNAVPPVLAWHLAQAIQNYLKGNSRNMNKLTAYSDQ